MQGPARFEHNALEPQLSEHRRCCELGDETGNDKAEQGECEDPARDFPLVGEIRAGAEVDECESKGGQTEDGESLSEGDEVHRALRILEIDDGDEHTT